MTPLEIAALVALIGVATLASYIQRVYSEYGKILSREVQENLDAWEVRIEPHLGLSREHAALCASVLKELSLGAIALGLGALLFIRPTHPGPPTGLEIAQAILAVVLVVIFAYQFIPSLLFNRTRGLWAARLLWLIRLLLWLVTPVTVFIRFFSSVASLAEAPAGPEEEPAPGVDELIEAGEEEGILEQSDFELVRSAVEFGDMLVREVMTPRPEIFAVPESTTIEHFLEMLRVQNYSRVPVYSGSLDNIKGLAFAHDLLQITDDEARTRTVATILHPAAFVPETKRGYELLREMQREKQHMRIVIDEYGAVAGLVTIEDLLEQIVGNIRDEHETDTQIEEPQREPSGSWLIPGSFPADQLGDVIGEPAEQGGDYEAATVGGLVSEIAGRIPKVGEVVTLEPLGLRVEVVASTGRRVERVRLFPPTARLPFPKES
ncbi:MAG: hemolysin family protein [Terracidiphilus sp.]|jgi:CBS domain containing-hemolysin-like protein